MPSAGASRPAATAASEWRLGDRSLELGPVPRLMGIVNVTPDSFSDGGAHPTTAAAIEHGLKLEAEGAAILDVGGESTRPGAEPVPVAEERARVLPVVEGLALRAGVPVSVDTTKPDVARRAIEAGARAINDVSALRFAPELAELAADTGAGLVLMHMRGEPRTMQREPRYDDLLGEISERLGEAAERARSVGVPAASIVIDPGIGFGKTATDSYRLLAGLDRLAGLGYPILVGHSRKTFLDPDRAIRPVERLPESIAAGVLAALAGAAILRVHDVAAHARALSIVARFREVGG